MKLSRILFFSLLFLGFSATAFALEQEGEIHLWHFDAETIDLGYTISSPDEQFHVGVLPGVLKGETDVTIKVFAHDKMVEREIYQVNAWTLNEQAEVDTSSRLTVDWPIPEGKELISPIYEFDIKGAADLYNPEKPLWLRVHYPAPTLENKGVYFYNKGTQEWIQIPAELFKDDLSYRAAIHLTYAPMAILADEIPSVGEASWYAYQDCNCAASRHYPEGTLLKVTHEGSGRSVIIEVNDYGPEEWTNRVIDLDVVAFEQLVPRGYGVTQVKVEPYIVTEEEFNNGIPQLFLDN
jgi:hypothetical protein